MNSAKNQIAGLGHIGIQMKIKVVLRVPIPTWPPAAIQKLFTSPLPGPRAPGPCESEHAVIEHKTARAWRYSDTTISSSKSFAEAQWCTKSVRERDEPQAGTGGGGVTRNAIRILESSEAPATRSIGKV